MKKTILGSLILCGTLVGAFGQGQIVVDNGGSGYPALDRNTVGNFYSGTYGFQVLELNSSTLPSNINSFSGHPLVAYNNLFLDGYNLEHTYVNQTILPSNAGTISLGTLNMPDVSPAGSTVCVALVAWTGSGNSFLTSSTAGVITFINPTGNQAATPPSVPASLTGWKALGQDLVMINPDPEPSMFALAGMSATALVMFRRNRSAKKQS